MTIIEIFEHVSRVLYKNKEIVIFLHQNFEYFDTTDAATYHCFTSEYLKLH